MIFRVSVAGRCAAFQRLPPGANERGSQLMRLVPPSRAARRRAMQCAPVIFSEHTPGYERHDNRDASECANGTVWLTVSPNLCCPVIAVRPRNMTAARTTVPKATVDKHHDFLDIEHEIGSAKRKWGLQPPSSDRGRREESAEAEFGGSIGATGDRSHVLTASMPMGK